MHTKLNLRKTLNLQKHILNFIKKKMQKQCLNTYIQIWNGICLVME